MLADRAETNSGGSRLRSIRHAAGLTQDRLSELAQVHVRTIRGLESRRIARPRRSTADALAAAMGLSLGGQAELLAAWGIYDPSPATSTLPPSGDGRLEVIEAYLARSRRELRVVAVIEKAVLGTDRRVARRSTEELLIAQESGVATRAIYYDPMDTGVPLSMFRLSDLVNCSVEDEVLDPTREGKLFMLRMAAPLRAGQTYLMRYAVDLATIRVRDGSRPDSGSEVTGLFHSPALHLLEVEFHGTDPPIVLEQVYQSRPTAELRSVAPLDLIDGRTCHLALVNPRPGGHGIAWRW